MQIFRRFERNHALDHALRSARELGKPLVVYEGLRLDYPWASRRLHRFLLEGMQASAARGARRDRRLPVRPPARVREAAPARLRGRPLAAARAAGRPRQLWGKKVLEWSPSPAAAYGVLEHLNNKYALDGRDPSSYSGILWCFGLFDRPWAPERPVFGSVRYMSSANTARKFNLKPYYAYVERLPTIAAARAAGRSAAV